jgi:hypothetical protein
MQQVILHVEKQTIVILNGDQLKRSIDLDKEGVPQAEAVI